MTEYEFRHSTLRDINYRIYAYQKEKEHRIMEIEYESWLTGIFFMEAIGCCFSKGHKYPKNPLNNERKTDENEISSKTGKTQEELLQEEKYFSMRVRQANANIAKTSKLKK